MGPATMGRFHASLPVQRFFASSVSVVVAPAAGSVFSAESDPAKSTCPALNCLIPAPEPVALYVTWAPALSCVKEAMASSMAFFWADEPSPLRWPLTAAAEPAPAAAPEVLEAEVDVVLLSLPQAARVRAPTTARPARRPDRVSFKTSVLPDP